jgi:hypothetical protein
VTLSCACLTPAVAGWDLPSGLRRSHGMAARAIAPTLLVLLLTCATASGAASTTRSRSTTFRLGAPPVALALAHSSVWVVVETKTRAAQLWRLDARTGRRSTSAVIGPAGPDIGAVAAAAAGVWAAAGNHVIGLGASRPGRIRRLRVPGTVTGLAAGFGSVWVTTIGAERDDLLRLDPATLAIRARIRTAGDDAVESALGSVWVAGGGSLARVDPRSDRLVSVLPLSTPGAELAVSARGLWLLEGGSALALDRAGRVRRRLALPFAAARIAVSDDRIWAIDNCGCAIGKLTTLELGSGRRLATWAVGATPVAVAADAREAWAASFGSSTLLRVPL